MIPSPLPRLAKGLCLAFPLVAFLPIATASADSAACEDELVEKVFAHHATAPSIESKVAIQTWLCEGASEEFLSQQATLPSDLEDLDGWNALLGQVNPDTTISRAPNDDPAVAEFRESNCPTSGRRSLVHALGRAATPQEFEAWHTCDAAAVDLANRSSFFFDLDLSCAGQQDELGNLVFSVRGFHAEHSNAVSGLTDLKFSLDNLTAVEDYSSASIPSAGSGEFRFAIADPSRDASIALEGAAETEFGPDFPVFYFCAINVESFPSTSTPYTVGKAAECAFDAPYPGETPCPDGVLEKACRDGVWEDTDTCIVQQADLTVVTTSVSGGSGSVLLPDSTSCEENCTFTAALDSTVVLQALPDTGSFVTWTGCAEADGNSCTVLMDSAKTVSASFTLDLVDVSVSTSTRSGGAGKVVLPDGTTCTGECSFSAGRDTFVTLETDLEPGTSADWTGCYFSVSNRCAVRMDDAKSVSVTFVGVSTLTVDVRGTAQGQVYMPSGRLCADRCVEEVENGTEVSLTATSIFAGVTWQGCTVFRSRCKVTMTRNRFVTATFAESTAVLVKQEGPRIGQVILPSGSRCSAARCSPWVDRGSLVEFTAVPPSRYRVRWEGCTRVDGNTCHVRAGQSTQIVARYSANLVLTQPPGFPSTGTRGRFELP